MLIKNITTGAADVAGVSCRWQVLNRAYLQKPLYPGEVTPAAASLTIFDLMTDTTFLRDLGIVTEERFNANTKAPIANASSAIRLGLRTLALDLDWARLVLPVNRAPSNPTAPLIEIYLTSAENWLLQSLESAARSMYTDDNVCVLRRVKNGVTSDCQLVAAIGASYDDSYTLASGIVLSKGATYWQIVDGEVTAVSAAAKTGAPNGTYVHTLGTITSVDEDANYQYNTEAPVLKATVEAGAADPAGYELAEGVVLKLVEGEYSITVGGYIYRPPVPATLTGAYTTVMYGVGSSIIDTASARNPESVGSAEALPVSMQAVAEAVEAKAAPVEVKAEAVEAKAAPIEVKAGAVEVKAKAKAPKGKKADTPVSLADLEASNQTV